MPPESGIILPVPEAEPIVGPLRALHDPHARDGVPAHITLLYPFVHPSKIGDALGPLRRLFSRIPVFDFSLVKVGRFPASAYLHPEPAVVFKGMTEMLVREWPECPPYGGAFSTVVPHLTIADQTTDDVLDSVHARVGGHLPVSCRATEVWLLCSDEHGTWSKREAFRLRG